MLPKLNDKAEDRLLVEVLHAADLLRPDQLEFELDSLDW